MKQKRPPSIQNLGARKAFFIANLDHPGALGELHKIFNLQISHLYHRAIKTGMHPLKYKEAQEKLVAEGKDICDQFESARAFKAKSEFERIE